MKKASLIAKLLEESFPKPLIPLKHKDPYTLLIAVLLSARCTDQRVNQITPILFAKADTPAQMVELSIEEIQKIIKPCGLSPRKAKSIWQLSQILLTKYGGKVPASFEKLESLPGVGHKTASVVMAQAFHKPAFPVDTHIYRLARRWGLSKARSIKAVEADLKQAFPKSKWAKLHLQMIYFGREYCKARGHDPHTCPVCQKIQM